MTSSPTDKTPDMKQAAPKEAERHEAYLDYKYNLQDKGIGRYFTPNRNVNYSARLYGAHFETPWHREASGIPAKSERWVDSMGGRMAIRTFSRGVMGAALMAWGQTRAQGYDPVLVEKALANPEAFAGQTNLYQRNLGRIAKLYDATFGKVWSCVLKPKDMRFRSKVVFSQHAMEKIGEEWFHDLWRHNREGLEALKGTEVNMWVREPYGEQRVLTKRPVFTGLDFSAPVLENLDEFRKEVTALFNHLKLPESSWQKFSEIWKTKSGQELVLPADEKYQLRHLQGRSYGHEVALMTHDFALGSVGDALGRSIAAVFDPNVYTSWWHEGKFDPVGFAKYMVNTAWNVLSYNQMEDWFAGIAYVHQMRLQREYIPGLFPGAKHAMDSRSTASFKLDDNGNIIGDYAKAGALDIQARFMGYNFYTLLFRDGYNHIEYMFKNWKDSGFSLHCSMPENPIESAITGVSETLKYIGKTFTKSMIYMTPAVPFFWMWRVPQNKANPLFVHPEEGPVTIGASVDPYEVGRHKMYNPYLAMTFENTGPVARAIQTDKNYGQMALANASRPLQSRSKRVHMGGLEVSDKPLAAANFNPYSAEHTHSVFSRMLNPMGRASSLLGEKLGTSLVSGMEKTGFAPTSADNTRFFAQNYVNAALAYTPYMIAKYETANWWDTPFMDSAIYRVEDGVTSLNPKEVWEGIKDIGRVIALRPVSYETYCNAFKARGLMNSTQESLDRANKRDLGFEKSFAEAVRKNGNDKEEKKKDETLPPDALPATVIQKTKPEEYVSISRLSDEAQDKTNGRTLH